MRKSIFTLSSALALLAVAPVAVSDEGWVDVQAKFRAAATNLSTPERNFTENAAQAMAIFAAYAKVAYRDIPAVKPTKVGNDVMLEFTVNGNEMFVMASALKAGVFRPESR